MQKHFYCTKHIKGHTKFGMLISDTGNESTIILLNFNKIIQTQTFIPCNLRYKNKTHPAKFKHSLFTKQYYVIKIVDTGNKSQQPTSKVSIESIKQ